jgi:aryl-alcohol dehydrogenase-like predicted oxidoreductase
MRYRTHHGVEISEIGIGCYSLSGVYGKKDLAAYRQMINRAYEMGVNFFDTADAYGDAEQILGETVKPYRHKVLLATKVGVKEGIKPDLSRAYVKQACQDSLRKLGTDYIDLYQVHFDDPDTSVEETVGALEELVRGGAIRHYGVGHLPIERITDYIKWGSLFSVLMELSAVAQDGRQVLLPVCRKHGVGGIGFSVTGRGILTGKYQVGHQFETGDIRHIDPLFQRERFQSGLRVAEVLTEVGHRYDKTPVQVAIAWVLAQPGTICALTGPSTVTHLEENLGGSSWVISPDDLAEIDRYLNEEDTRLKGEQRGSIGRLLTQPLHEDPSQAFVDLIYIIETAVQLGEITEAEILPLFHELYRLRERLDIDAVPELEGLQNRLDEMISL